MELEECNFLHLCYTAVYPQSFPGHPQVLSVNQHVGVKIPPRQYMSDAIRKEMGMAQGALCRHQEACDEVKMTCDYRDFDHIVQLEQGPFWVTIRAVPIWRTQEYRQPQCPLHQIHIGVPFQVQCLTDLLILLSDPFPNPLMGKIILFVPRFMSFPKNCP